MAWSKEGGMLWDPNDKLGPRHLPPPPDSWEEFVRERINYGIMIKDPSSAVFYRPNFDRDDRRNDKDAMENKNKTRFKNRYQRLKEEPKPKIDPTKVISAVYQHKERRFVIVYEDYNGAIVPLKISREEFYRIFSPNDIAIMNQMNSLTEHEDAERIRRNDDAQARKLLMALEEDKWKKKIVFESDPTVPDGIKIYVDEKGAVTKIDVDADYKAGNQNPFQKTFNKQLDEDIRKAKAHVEKKEEEVITWDEDDFVKPISNFYERKSRPWWKKVLNIRA